MNENHAVENDNDTTMEIENVEYAVQIAQPIEEIHPLALVAINIPHVEAIVEGPTGNIETVDNGVIVEASSSNEDRTSPSVSAASSRVPSPATSEASDLTEKSESDVAGPTHSKKRSHSEDPHDDDGAVCPICLDDWTSTGAHRICSLKCGHLFGYQCVTQWLNSQRKRTCPTCKKKVGRDDIRYIYAKKLTAVDTAELENVKQQLQKAREEWNKAQSELAKCAFREHMLIQENAQLRAQLNNYNRKTVISFSNANQAPEPVRLHMEKSIDVCKAGGSRVFDAKCELDLLMASMKSPTNLFTGYGLKKIGISNYRTIAFIPVHSLQIRDISFHHQNNWILTASMDKTFKVVDNTTNTVIYQFGHQMPLWSCCWDVNNAAVLYVGAQSGSVMKYDVRRLSEPVAVLAVEGDTTPVVSVASVPAAPGEALPLGGVVSCKLNSLWLYEGEQHVRHPLSLEGPFVSMKYQAESKQLLVSSRPNSRIAYSRHTLCTLERKAQDKVDCNVVHSFRGGGMQTLLSKSCFLSHDGEYVAAHQENCRSVVLWSVNTGERVCSLPAHEAVIDLKGLQNQNGDYLVSLTEKKLEFFKFT